MVPEACVTVQSDVDSVVARRTHVKTVRELWNLRDQARVREVERGFLQDLQHVLNQTMESFMRSDSSDIEEVEESTLDIPLYEGDRELERYREQRTRVMEETRALNQRHHVRRLNRFFTEPHPERQRVIRSASWGSDLAEARTVSNALDSEFRHHLENVVSRRDHPSRRNRRRAAAAEGAAIDEGMYAQGSIQDEVERIEREEQQQQERGWAVPSDSGHRKLTATVRNLEEEVAQLRNVINAGFDIQLDIQRAIRQEISAAIHAGIPVAPQAGTPGCSSNGFQPHKSGRCTVCLEEPIDSLLYSCGHMCTCSACGRGLLVAAQKCPICRAPVRDVVRCFVVTEGAT
mmetsp:Transcript_8072/g.24320  ORF Transcript_8072/g.24320 Transcript_8072/m.24320 type:complete len:346 (-) Transcript_8072:150-1187(-)|eukprot:CAMPEP_0198734232 /NCGR_PEP_ID=MMETSP1475-20131203/51241_1 /TAXON_ID= ORGANISM="Unidentified sp., Strain CCMP1999" /NCGR_SAMPLE_ID=MMETSP1475 /ASSEMBLY_ACC=CAM_ASM_001111 /LENGTH=345 /DNA_ID=CAMNT_0044497663 /DNA_START=141 /DNA_END=1178 /DNA_ORIENTATION=+